MNNVSKVNGCANCGCCVSICPVEAISEGSDGLFYRVRVNESLCKDCGECLKRCPVNDPPRENRAVNAYVCWSKDKELVAGSSSGGLFGELSRYVLKNGGVVFGAAYSEDNKSVLIRSTDETELEKLQKSKYVESSAGKSFADVKKALNSGRKVLFCSTPCQAAGLRSYLGKEYEDLLILDFACGGLPSHSLYRSYIDDLEKRYRSKAVSVDFRPKTHGWERHAILISFANGKTYNRLGTEDDYFRTFLYGKLTVRENCLSCKFSDSHASDITLADFWRHKELSPLHNSDGTSLVLCNTKKGESYMRAISGLIESAELDAGAVCYNNKKTVPSEKALKKRKEFIDACKSKGFITACAEFAPRSLKKTVKSAFARYIYKK